MKFFFLLLVILGSQMASAMDVAVSAAGRSYPTSGSAEVVTRHEFLLWDQREDAMWKFGFIQPKLTAGTHGFAEAGLNFYPISILELGAGYSTTSRFYETKPFDCKDNVCKGIVQKHRLTARLVGAVGDFMAILTAHRIRISEKDDSKPLVDETEVLLAYPGSDTLEAYSLLAGMKKGGQESSDTFGIYLKQGRYIEARTKNESQYLVYRKQDGAWSYAGGLGRYASDFSDPGFSAYATVIWTWGKSISLF